MSSVYTLDTINPLLLKPGSFDGFDLPDDVTVVPILGDGTSDFNGVLQSPGNGLPVAHLDGWSFEAGEISALKALRASKAHVFFTEPLGNHTVVVTQLSVKNNAGLPWEWSMTLIELPYEGT